MANSTHAYAKEITFEKHSKAKYDRLLDQVKILDIGDYNLDTLDGFVECCEYWDERSTRDFNRKLESNDRNIANL